LTIAAGFVYSGGILLCSDTQQEGGLLKIHAPKVCHFETAYGRIGFAMAGNILLARSAIQHCKAALDNVEPKATISTIETVLDHEYDRTVLKHPLYGKDESLPYWLLISMWSKAAKTTALFFTHENTVESCFESFYAIGNGFELANVLVRPFIFDKMSEDNALILAAYTLARVKDNVAGCGGDSQFLAMRDDGTVEPIAEIKLEQIAEIAAAYDKAAHALLFSMGSEANEDLDMALDVFGSQARSTRDYWRKLRKLRPPIPPRHG
jgi:hypothetical protein